jgi:hypothetical protein
MPYFLYFRQTNISNSLQKYRPKNYILNKQYNMQFTTNPTKEKRQYLHSGIYNTVLTVIRYMMDKLEDI